MTSLLVETSSNRCKKVVHNSSRENKENHNRDRGLDM